MGSSGEYNMELTAMTAFYSPNEPMHFRGPWWDRGSWDLCLFFSLSFGFMSLR